MTKFNFEQRVYCVKCDQMVRVLHEHSTRLIEEPPAGSPYERPPRLPPGWSAMTLEQITQALEESEVQE